MEGQDTKKQKRCPKGTRRNKEGICVPIETVKVNNISSPKSEMGEPNEKPTKKPRIKVTKKKLTQEMPTESNEKPAMKKMVAQQKKIQSERMKQLQDTFKEDIIVPVSKGSKCPKGTRKNKENQCILTKEFKDMFIKRKACIQTRRDQLV